MAGCPYDRFSPSAWWRPSVARLPYAAISPISAAPFQIDRADLIAAAGSCFAQEISRYIVDAGYQFLVTEDAPARFTADERRARQYGLFSARYGNIYTSRQLLQLIQRAYGEFEPAEDYWTGPDGAFFDPFRPSVEPGGFAALEELLWDREHHLASVRLLVETSNVFVFTLGLTEMWRSRADGAAYPVCPGCGVGRYDPALYEPHNLTVGEIRDDLERAYALLKQHNPRLRLILTVSPVPLIATMTNKHVLAATTYSKSALRAAAGEFSERDDVCYFPSFEIITGQYTQDRTYFGPDRRTVTREGVDHVMRCFFEMFSSSPTTERLVETTSVDRPVPVDRSAEIIDVVCDEEDLQRRYEAAARE